MAHEMGALIGHRAPRTKRARTSLSHDQRRITAHDFGFIDPQRTADASAEVGNASWVHPFGDLFGNLNAVLHYMPRDSARIIKFPAKAGMK
jgi:hypothetical protein